MSDHSLWHIHIDGAARGNPGPAAFAFVIARDGVPAVEEKGCLGNTTNNLAEYTALVRALERAAELGASRLLIHSDSELLVKQMNGEYRVKNEHLRPLYEEARQLVGRFNQVLIRHVRREQNRDADRLCNEALDGTTPRPAAAKAKPKKRPADTSGREAAVRDEAVACLRAAAAAWARGNQADPPPEQVWDQLWSILDEHGLLPRPRARS